MNFCLTYVSRWSNEDLSSRLLRFESCLCQSLPGSTCRMLFPPDFYQQSLPSNYFNNQQNNMPNMPNRPNMPNNGPETFLVAFQDESGVKSTLGFCFCFFGKKIINIYVIDSSSFPEVRFTYVQKLYLIMRLDIIFPLRKAFSHLTKLSI